MDSTLTKQNPCIAGLPVVYSGTFGWYHHPKHAGLTPPAATSSSITEAYLSKKVLNFILLPPFFLLSKLIPY